MTFQTCLFDLDGTLIDTIDDLGAATEQVLTEYGLGNPDGTPVHTRERYHQFVGNGIRKLVERAFGDTPVPEAAHARFAELYDRNCKVKTAPYDGIYEVLDALKAKGVKMGVVTNKPEAQARYLADAFFHDYNFCCVYGSVDDRPNKPDPTSLYMALRDCDADAATTLFVGDSNVDVQTAHNGSLICAGASWGFRGEEELRREGAEILLDHPTDVLAYF